MCVCLPLQVAIVIAPSHILATVGGPDFSHKHAPPCLPTSREQRDEDWLLQHPEPHVDSWKQNLFLKNDIIVAANIH